MSDERMKEIIAALLESEGRTEAEAQAAQAKAAKLMAKMGMSREDILADNPDLVSAEIEITRFEWVVCQHIMVVVGKLTGTSPWYDVLPTASGKRSDRKKITYAGYRSDVDQASWLFRHLLDAANEGSRSISVASERTSYLIGFGGAVRHRVDELVQALNTERPELDPSTGSDLVVVRDKAVDDFVQSLVGTLVSGRDKGSRVKDGEAYLGGQVAGKSVSLGRGVGGSGPKALPSS